MRWVSLLALFCFSALGGCASTGSNSSHVLSGNAPVEKVVGKADETAQSGDYRAASILYRQALRQEPSAEIWYRLGVSTIRLGDAEQAMWAFRNALEIDADHPGSLERIGLYLTSKDRPEEAGPYLQRLLEIDAENWRAHNALGVLADLEGDYEKAAKKYAAAIELKPDMPMLWNNLGFSYYLAGDYDGAIRTLVKALQLKPDYHAARHNAALVFARQSRYEEALEILKRAGTESDAYSDAGYLAFKMGDHSKAEELLIQAIRHSTTYNRQAHRNLAAVREARTAAAQGD